MSRGLPLKETERAAMRMLYRSGWTLAAIGRKLKRSESCVSGVVRGARINQTTATANAALLTFRLACHVPPDELADVLGIDLGKLDRLESGRLLPEDIAPELTWWRIMRAVEELAGEAAERRAEDARP